jgi:hypothetical protein
MCWTIEKATALIAEFPQLKLEKLLEAELLPSFIAAQIAGDLLDLTLEDYESYNMRFCVALIAQQTLMLPGMDVDMPWPVKPRKLEELHKVRLKIVPPEEVLD